MNGCCRRALLAAPLLACRPARAQATLRVLLAAADALDPYLADMIAPLAAGLGANMALPDDVLVAVVRPARDRGALPEIPALLAESPLTDIDARVVWIDSDFLRLLVMRIGLVARRDWGGAALSSAAAVAQSLLHAPPEAPEWWQEPTAPALVQPVLREAVRGAAAFLLAHEFAHLLLGPAPWPLHALAGLPRRARQLAPMCPDLTHESVKARRAYEEQADRMALAAVHQLPRGPVGQGGAGLPGDLGIAMLLNLMLGADLVRLGTTLELPLAARMLEQQLGADVFASLRAAAPLPGTDLVRLAYSDTHPAALQRLLEVMRQLSETEGSLWYGDTSVATSQGLMQLLVQRACAEAEAALGAVP